MKNLAGRVGAIALVGLSFAVAAVVVPLSWQDVRRYRRLRRM